MLHRAHALLEYGSYKAEGKGILTTNGYVIAWGLTVPTDAETGYATGCEYHHVDGSGETDAVYVNIGDNTSCNFNAASVAAD